MGGLSEWPPKVELAGLVGGDVTLGVFDGVHEGHRYLIETLRDAARSAHRSCSIITFDRDPDEVFQATGFHKLMTDETRIATLRGLGCDQVVVLPFTLALASMAPEAFLDRLFSEGVPHSVFVGQGFRFGYRCSGDSESMVLWGASRGMDVHSYGLLEIDGHVVSSTTIRRLLAEGDVTEAARLLGRPYRLEGRVVHGRAEGQQMGIRTANLHIPDLLLAIGEGVYGCYATVDGVRYKAAVSVGVAPTFEKARANVEVHLLDFDGDLYEQPMAVDFIAWLRPMRHFASVDELVTTINGNIDWVRTHL